MKRSLRYCLEDVSEEANNLIEKIFLAIKDEVANNEIWIARFVVQRQKDSLNHYSVHSLPPWSPGTNKLPVGIASST